LRAPVVATRQSQQVLAAVVVAVAAVVAQAAVVVVALAEPRVVAAQHDRRLHRLMVQQRSQTACSGFTCRRTSTSAANLKGKLMLETGDHGQQRQPKPTQFV